jgi:hypothetical protein
LADIQPPAGEYAQADQNENAGQSEQYTLKQRAPRYCGQSWHRLTKDCFETEYSDFTVMERHLGYAL